MWFKEIELNLFLILRVELQTECDRRPSAADHRHQLRSGPHSFRKFNPVSAQSKVWTSFFSELNKQEKFM